MTPWSAPGAPRPMSPLRAAALFVALAVAAPFAQAPPGAIARNTEPAPDAAGGPAPPPTSEASAGQVQLLVGRSTLVSVAHPIVRVSLTTPNVADAMVTSPQQLLLHGKAPGTISLFVWDRAGGITKYEVVVQRDLTELSERLQQLFPADRIAVSSNGKDVVLSGSVSGKYAIEKAAEVARGYVEKKEDVVNLLVPQDGIASRQVLLRVRFAEVSRTALTELGTNLAANGFKNGRWFGRTTTQQFAAPFWDEEGRFVFSDFLNLFLFDSKNQLAASVRLLQEKGLFQSLAEPNLIAEDGKEASFLAGGEYPYPIVQGQSGGTSVTIQFKEYGIRLNFVPTIVGSDLVKLKVRPEVSSLDFANAVTLNGFRVPAITTRRTETEVELQDGQTFAVAGLMNNTMTSQMSKIPGIGDIPILGYLFRSKAARKDQTELVVMITPTILRRNSTGVSSTVPDIIEPFLAPPQKTMPPPAPWNRDARPQPSTQLEPAPGAVTPAGPPATPAGSAPHAASAGQVLQEPVAAQQPSPEPQPAVAIPPAPSPAMATPADATKAANGPALRDKQAPEDQKRAERQARKEQAAARKKAAEQQAQAERAAAEQAARDRKAAAAQAKADAKRAAAEKKQAEQAAKEQARLEAELQKQQAAAARRQAEIDRERAEEIARAEQRLKAAQKEYESAVGQKQQ